MTQLHPAPNYPIDGVAYHDGAFARRNLAAGHWLDLSVGDSLRATAAATPDKAAVIGPGESLSFAALDAQTESVAASLLERACRRATACCSNSGRASAISSRSTAA